MRTRGCWITYLLVSACGQSTQSNASTTPTVSVSEVSADSASERGDDDAPLPEAERGAEREADTPAERPEPEPEPVSCGGLSCSSAQLGSLALPGCCTPNGGCGIDVSRYTTGLAAQLTTQCIELNAPGRPEPSCSLSQTAGSAVLAQLPGCCTPAGTCGVSVNMPPFPSLGCVDMHGLGLGQLMNRRGCTP